jgi:hypothetical protein
MRIAQQRKQPLRALALQPIVAGVALRGPAKRNPCLSQTATDWSIVEHLID